MDWIISLAAVLVSLVTIVISYFTNKENLKNASENILSERNIDFKIAVWNETIDLCNELILATNSKHLEQFVNLTVAGKTNDMSDEEILNTLNENCEQIHANVFKLCVKVRTLDNDCETLLNEIREYAHKVIDLYQDMQEFYLDTRASQEAYHHMVTAVEEFNKTDVEFSRKLQNYIVSLREKLFITEKGGKA